jgi:hypothetical protein
MYIDWARGDGLARVAQTAYQSLAEQIADDVFRPVTEPPLLIGPGQKQAGLQTSETFAAAVRTVLGPAICGKARFQLVPAKPRLRGHLLWRPDDGFHTEEAVGFQFVSSGQESATAIEIYTAKPESHLHIQPSRSGSEDSVATQNDAEWALDGLQNDRNAVVQFISCLAAVPIGLWEQTVGVARLHSQDKTAKLAQALDDLPEQRHFAGKLADEVARRLRSQVVNQVRRTEGPPRFALAIPGETGAAESAALGTPTSSQLALQLQVTDSKLIGKRANSRTRALCVQMQATVIRPSDGQELYSRPIVYRSSLKALKDWAASDASQFRQELDACSRQAAEALTGELIQRGLVTPGSGSGVPNEL